MAALKIGFSHRHHLQAIRQYSMQEVINHPRPVMPGVINADDDHIRGGRFWTSIPKNKKSEVAERCFFHAILYGPVPTLWGVRRTDKPRYSLREQSARPIPSSFVKIPPDVHPL